MEGALDVKSTLVEIHHDQLLPFSLILDGLFDLLHPLKELLTTISRLFMTQHNTITFGDSEVHSCFLTISEQHNGCYSRRQSECT